MLVRTLKVGDAWPIPPGATEVVIVAASRGRARIGFPGLDPLEEKLLAKEAAKELRAGSLTPNPPEA